MNKSYLFLYTELAGYTIACLKALRAADPNARITVVHFPINKDAPFQFDFEAIGSFYQTDVFPNYASLKQLAQKISPNHIICSGWIKKDYIRLCFAWRKKATTILCFDNQLNGSLKQWVWKLTGARLLRKIFKKLWLPGKRQFEYARFLGFRKDQLVPGFYSCDVPLFKGKGDKVLPAKALDFPKVMICVARYIPEKAYRELWDAFMSWQDQEPSRWELWCVGTGPDFNARQEHPKIKHLGFIQPSQMDELIEKAGVFVLLSKFEPWGVAVHEFAAAGFPLLLSPQVGASDSFLHSSNGWLIKSHNIEDIINSFREIAAQTPGQLHEKALNSMELALKVSPQTWAQTLMQA